MEAPPPEQVTRILVAGRGARSQAEVAKALGLNQVQWWRWERDGRVSPKHAAAVCAQLALSREDAEVVLASAGIDPCHLEALFGP